MLIGFYGPPCSGKTILAHALFASLKFNGINGEFVSEWARKHIATFPKGIKLKGLDDEDQKIIINRQSEEEQIFLDQGSLVVTDTCSVNTCFYSDELCHMETIEEEIKRYDILFVTSLLEEKIGSGDKNRVLDLNQCRKLNVKMFDTLNSVDPKIFVDRFFYLVGTEEDKVSAAISLVKEKISDKH